MGGKEGLVVSGDTRNMAEKRLVMRKPKLLERRETARVPPTDPGPHGRSPTEVASPPKFCFWTTRARKLGAILVLLWEIRGTVQ